MLFSRTYWLPLPHPNRPALVARYLFTLETELCRVLSGGLWPTGLWHWRQSCEPHQPRRACCLHRTPLPAVPGAPVPGSVADF